MSETRSPNADVAGSALNGPSWITTPPISTVGVAAATAAAKGLSIVAAADIGSTRVGAAPTDLNGAGCYGYWYGGKPLAVMALNASSDVLQLQYLGAGDGESACIMIEHALNLIPALSGRGGLRPGWLSLRASSTWAAWLGGMGFSAQGAEMTLDARSNPRKWVYYNEWRRPLAQMAQPGLNWVPGLGWCRWNPWQNCWYAVLPGAHPY